MLIELIVKVPNSVPISTLGMALDPGFLGAKGDTLKNCHHNRSRRWGCRWLEDIHGFVGKHMTS
jgi:hypothetical protein